MARKHLHKQAYPLIREWATKIVRVNIGKIPAHFKQTIDLYYSENLRSLGVDPDTEQVYRYYNEYVVRFTRWANDPFGHSYWLTKDFDVEELQQIMEYR